MDRFLTCGNATTVLADENNAVLVDEVPNAFLSMMPGGSKILIGRDGNKPPKFLTVPSADASFSTLVDNEGDPLVDETGEELIMYELGI